ncbi:MAG TPA: hypothetical protein VMR52_12895 [Dehalococcoidia bacterium]|nr:hypothetical protein [Dehalococcoidia bacterium]
MPEQDRTEILLQQILNVLAATAVQSKTMSEGAPYLERLGVERSVIATVYDTSDASVRAILSQVKSKKGRK